MTRHPRARFAALSWSIALWDGARFVLFLNEGRVRLKIRLFLHQNEHQQLPSDLYCSALPSVSKAPQINKVHVQFYSVASFTEIWYTRCCVWFFKTLCVYLIDWRCYGLLVRQLFQILYSFVFCLARLWFVNSYKCCTSLCGNHLSSLFRPSGEECHPFRWHLLSPRDLSAAGVLRRPGQIRGLPEGPAHIRIPQGNNVT